MIETSGSTSSHSNHITGSLRVLFPGMDYSSNHITGSLRVLFPGMDYSSTLKVEKVGSFNMMVISTRLHGVTSRR